MSADILVEKVGKVTTISINRPEKRNCINRETAQELNQAIEEFEKDENAIAGVLYGIGGNFCSGYDLDELADSEGNLQDLISNTETGFVVSEYVTSYFWLVLRALTHLFSKR